MKAFKTDLLLTPLTLAAALIWQAAPITAQAAVMIPPGETRTTTFSTPTRYCFDKGQSTADRTKYTLTYNLVVRPEDIGKTADIFVAFRFQETNKPAFLFGRANLYTDYSWSAYDPQISPTFYSRSTRLEAVVPIWIAPQPINLDALGGVGDVLVGYGLRTDPEQSLSDTFKEMISNDRFDTLWSVGRRSVATSHICLTVTEMTEIGVATPF